MKKITSKTPITFKVDGKTTLEITSKGVLCSSEHAAIAKERLGMQITVEDTNAEAEAAKIKKEEDKKAKKAAADAEAEKIKKEKEEDKKAKKAAEEANKQSGDNK